MSVSYTHLAVKMINDIDKRRMTNYNFYTDQKWGKAANYTLCLNSSQLGYDKCESIIIAVSYTHLTLYSVDLLNLDTCRNDLLLEDIGQYGRKI